MIEVELNKNVDGTVYGFRVSGHAGFSQKGSDIVCSAVSILVINAINSIESLTKQEASVNMNDEKGIIDCVLELSDGIIDSDADIIVKSMVLGLRALEEQYGEYIKISEEAPR